MIKKDLILIGAGGHASSCIDVIEQDNDYKIIGLIGRKDEVGSQILNYPIIGTDEDLFSFKNKYQNAFITLGQIDSPLKRIEIFNLIKDLGYLTPSIISSKAIVSKNTTIGDGSIIMHGSIINARANIGENCIINSLSLVEHDVKVSDHSHISTGAIINGGVEIGLGSFIGSGAVIKEGIKIGKGCVIGMGLSVRHDIPDNFTYIGPNRNE